MKQSIKFHKYSINFEKAPNSQTTNGEVEGALIKINAGYACIQPWITLGDNDLEYHLESIASNKPTDIAKAAIKCCFIDGKARSNKVDLFQSLTPPKYHLTFNPDDLFNIDPNSINSFTHLKIKSNENFVKILEIINKFSQFKIRLDFNESITPRQLMDFNESLSSHTRNKIDFIEDPFPYDPDLWCHYQKQTGLNFALDRGPYNANKGFKVRIWKPVILSSVETIQPICITHNMDHEFGRRYAAYCASITNYSIKVHGIGDFNHNRNGYGLGMDDYLESLSWKDLI